MPQYAYNIDGQRHVFEGPDPQTTAQFAQRWAAAQASARAAAANDNRPQVGRRRSQFAADIGARAKQDVASLTGAIDQVRAHPTDLLNGPRILSAVTRYVPNALGLAPAAGVDQLTGPVIRAFNSRFGTHFDPRYATDQILSAAGLLSGAPEVWGPEESLARAADRLKTGEASDATPSAMAAVGKPPELIPPRPKAKLTAAYTPPQVHIYPSGLNSAGEDVVGLSGEFLDKHEQRLDSLRNLPKVLQEKYKSTVEDNIINPILDNPDYGGHNATTVQAIIGKLATIADARRALTGHSGVADALDDANADFRVLVHQQQPWMARELGLDIARGIAPGARSGDTAPAAPLPTVGSAAQQTPANAFSSESSGPENPTSTTVPAGRQVDGLDFNALRPPRWFGPTMVGAANQPQGPRPQN